MSFANSSLFATPNMTVEYKPFMEISKVRAMFDNGTQIGVALGGWGDTDGFGAGAKTETSRKQYAQNIAIMSQKLGLDFIGECVCICAVYRTISLTNYHRYRLGVPRRQWRRL